MTISEFITFWGEYFPGQPLPVGFNFADDLPDPSCLDFSHNRCMICDLQTVIAGKSIAYHQDSIRCGGAKRYLGFSQTLSKNFPYFLSYGIPGELEGERYKKTPELVNQWLEKNPFIAAKGKYIVFTRIDQYSSAEQPLAVIFFAKPDILSGLFTLASFTETHEDAVIAPFGSGCASIVYYPLREIDSERSRVVLGLFDVSARSCVPENTLTFTVPWEKFVAMVSIVEESFLTTDSWQKVKQRL